MYTQNEATGFNCQSLAQTLTTAGSVESEFTRESEQLDREISTAFEVIQLLEKRLQPVLRSIPVGNPQVDQSNSKDTLAAISASARRQREGVRSIREITQTLLDQLAI